MSYIEQEIMTQHEALRRTMDWFDAYGEETVRWYHSHSFRQIVFMGCGSSYMLARSGAALFALRTPMKTHAVAGGDFLINPRAYRNLFEDALVVVLTRSGRTSEINLAVDGIRRMSDAKILCIHARSGTEVPEKSDYEIPLDWAFDESVCQTRTVTNFYCALAALCALASDDQPLMDELRQAAADNESFKQTYRPALNAIGRGSWDHAVVLADGELSGLAQEGALAFCEICMKPGVSYPLLDFRHGPMVLASGKTLVIAVVRRETPGYQLDLIADLKKKNATVICVGAEPDIPGADLTVCLPGYRDYAVWGIPFIYVPQMTAFSRAVADGHDPDHPEGLDPYITL